MLLLSLSQQIRNTSSGGSGSSSSPPSSNRQLLLSPPPPPKTRTPLRRSRSDGSLTSPPSAPSSDNNPRPNMIGSPPPVPRSSTMARISFARPGKRGRSLSPPSERKQQQGHKNNNNKSNVQQQQQQQQQAPPPTPRSTKLRRWASMQQMSSSNGGANPVGNSKNSRASSFRRGGRRVRFSREKPDIIRTLSRDQFSDREYFSYWIQPDEMDRCIERNWNIVDAYEKYKVVKKETAPPGASAATGNTDTEVPPSLLSPKDFKMCTRGLESYIIERKRGKKVHLIKKKNAYTAVLLWGRDLSDEERSRRYQTVSKRCMKRAIEYGRRDAIVAKRILAEDLMAGIQRLHRSQSDIITGAMTSRDLEVLACMGSPAKNKNNRTIGRPARRNTSAATAMQMIPGNNHRGLPRPNRIQHGPRRAVSLNEEAMRAALSSAVKKEPQAAIATSRKSPSKRSKSPNKAPAGPPNNNNRRASMSPPRSRRDPFLAERGGGVVYQNNIRRNNSDGSDITIAPPPPLLLEEIDENDFRGLVAQMDGSTHNRVVVVGDDYDVAPPHSPIASTGGTTKYYDHPFASPVISPSARALKSAKVIFSMLHKNNM